VLIPLATIIVLVAVAVFRPSIRLLPPALPLSVGRPPICSPAGPAGHGRSPAACRLDPHGPKVCNNPSGRFINVSGQVEES